MWMMDGCTYVNDRMIVYVFLSGRTCVYMCAQYSTRAYRNIIFYAHVLDA